MFLDSDDWLEDNALEVFLEAQMKYPDKVIASVAYMVELCAEHNALYRTQPNKFPSPQIFSSVEEVFSTFFSSQHINYFFTVALKIFSSNVIREHNIMFPNNIHYGEDQLFMLEYMLQMNGMILLNTPLVNVLYRPDSAEHITYNERRIFVDGKLVDFAQMMIDMAKTPELKKLLKFNHARLMRFELLTALRRKASTDRINKVREKMRIYLHEYITSKYISFARKVKFLYLAYMPIPLAKFSMLLLNILHKSINIVKHSNKKEIEEIIPYW